MAVYSIPYLNRLIWGVQFKLGFTATYGFHMKSRLELEVKIILNATEIRWNFPAHKTMVFASFFVFDICRNRMVQIFIQFLKILLWKCVYTWFFFWTLVYVLFFFSLIGYYGICYCVKINYWNFRHISHKWHCTLTTKNCTKSWYYLKKMVFSFQFVKCFFHSFYILKYNVSISTILNYTPKVRCIRLHLFGTQFRIYILSIILTKQNHTMQKINIEIYIWFICTCKIFLCLSMGHE